MDEARNISAGEKKSGNGVQTLLASFRQVGLPLMSALVDSPEARESGNKDFDPEKYGKMMESAVALSRELASRLGVAEESLDGSVRWALSGSASQVVAASYRASGQVLSADEAKKIADIAVALQEKFKNIIPSGGETLPNTVATFRAKMMEAMVPVIGAVAQYSFARAEHGLLADIAEKLVKISDQITRALAPAGATPEQWRMLCWNILRAAGQIYTECHYAEADRLLYMDEAARVEYFSQHGSVPPMTQVWQAFNQRMAMLATLATYLEVPETAQLEDQGWS